MFSSNVAIDKYYQYKCLYKCQYKLCRSYYQFMEYKNISILNIFPFYGKFALTFIISQLQYYAMYEYLFIFTTGNINLV